MNDIKFTFTVFFALTLFWNGRSPEPGYQHFKVARKKPNILFVISDDQSYPHASAYGYKSVSTPAFDRIAHEGALFTNAISASPGCSPSRAALLTGRNCWQLEEAGTHGSLFPAKYITYVDILEKAGYFVGYTGKGWGPGDWKSSNRKRNPAGPVYNDLKTQQHPEGMAAIDYAANFAKFLSERDKQAPFCFWFGAQEPHRIYDKGIGLKRGKKLQDVVVPAFLPDNPEVRSDILDYCVEIEWFDQHLGQMLKLLEESGELDNTLIVVTSDNGMAFPRAKANTYEYGIHVPLAMRWPGKIKKGIVVDRVVSLVNIAPTFLEAAGLQLLKDKTSAYPMEGQSLLASLHPGDTKEAGLAAAYSSRERHSSSRWNNLSYPQRALRTKDYLFIQNFKPDRWPAGDPQELIKDSVTGTMRPAPMHRAYYDIDASPTLSFLEQKSDDSLVSRYFHLAVDKRPAEELYDIKNDPGCVHNLANNPSYRNTYKALHEQLNTYLKKTKDPRVTRRGEVFETYPRTEGVLRNFPAPAGSR